AGERRAGDRAILLCKPRGAKRTIPLPVSAPFHSVLMRPAGERLKDYLARVEVAAPRLAVINNVDVKVESDPAAIKDALVRQASAPVRWMETIQRRVAQGATHIGECAPGA